MKKGFILVDIPERCSVCKYMQSKQKGKPDWCPVRKFPEQMKPSQFPISPILPWQYTEYEKGWNDCIKQMGGE